MNTTPMIQLHLYAFLGLLELLVVTVAAAAFFYWRWRRVRRTVGGVTAGPGPGQPEPPATGGSGLVLRQALLEVERLRAEGRLGADAEGRWQELDRQLVQAAAAAGFVERQPGNNPDSLIYGENGVELDKVVAFQEQTIGRLQDYIADLLERLAEDRRRPEDEAEMQARFDELERTNRELNQCVAVLEDENEFLRRQIAELLRLMQEQETEAAFSADDSRWSH